MAKTAEEVTGIEIAAGKAALHKFLEANLSSWKRSMIPEDMIDRAMEEVIVAVDAAREAAAVPQEPQPAPPEQPEADQQAGS